MVAITSFNSALPFDVPTKSQLDAAAQSRPVIVHDHKFKLNGYMDADNKNVDTDNTHYWNKGNWPGTESYHGGPGGADNGIRRGGTSRCLPIPIRPFASNSDGEARLRRDSRELLLRAQSALADCYALNHGKIYSTYPTKQSNYPWEWYERHLSVCEDLLEESPNNRIKVGISIDGNGLDTSNNSGTRVGAYHGSFAGSPACFKIGNRPLIIGFGLEKVSASWWQDYVDAFEDESGVKPWISFTFWINKGGAYDNRPDGKGKMIETRGLFGPGAYTIGKTQDSAAADAHEDEMAWMWTLRPQDARPDQEYYHACRNLQMYLSSFQYGMTRGVNPHGPEGLYVSTWSDTGESTDIWPVEALKSVPDLNSPDNPSDRTDVTKYGFWPHHGWSFCELLAYMSIVWKGLGTGGTGNDMFRIPCKRDVVYYSHRNLFNNDTTKTKQTTLIYTGSGTARTSENNWTKSTTNGSNHDQEERLELRGFLREAGQFQVSWDEKATWSALSSSKDANNPITCTQYYDLEKDKRPWMRLVRNGTVVLEWQSKWHVYGDTVPIKSYRLGVSSSARTLNEVGPGDTPGSGVNYSITPTNTSITENNTNLTFTITRSDTTEGAVTRYVSVIEDAGHTNVNNFTPVSKAAVSFGASDTSKTYNVGILENTADEPNKTFRFIVQKANNLPDTDRLAETTFTITDDDEPQAVQTYSIEPSHIEVNEHAGDLTFTIRRSITNVTSSVWVGTADGVGLGGTGYTNVNNYTPVATTVNFTNGQATAEVKVAAIQNSTTDGDKTFALIAKASSGASAYIARATFKIFDDEGDGGPGPVTGDEDLSGYVPSLDRDTEQTIHIIQPEDRGYRLKISATAQSGDRMHGTCSVWVPHDGQPPRIQRGRDYVAQPGLGTRNVGFGIVNGEIRLKHMGTAAAEWSWVVERRPVVPVQAYMTEQVVADFASPGPMPSPNTLPRLIKNYETSASVYATARGLNSIAASARSDSQGMAVDAGKGNLARIEAGLTLEVTFGHAAADQVAAPGRRVEKSSIIATVTRLTAGMIATWTAKRGGTTVGTGTITSTSGEAVTTGGLLDARKVVLTGISDDPDRIIWSAQAGTTPASAYLLKEMIVSPRTA